MSAVADQDGGEPGTQRRRAVGVHSQRDAELPAVRFRRPQRASRRCPAPAALRQLHATTPRSRTWCSRSRSPTSSIWPTAPCSGPSAPRVEEARTNLAAAEERRRVGLATIADVLQARTAASQAQLDLQTIEGNVQTTRGALALVARPARQPAVRCGSTVAIAACGVARRQRERHHRHRAPGPSRPGREPRRGRGGARRHHRGAGGAAAFARLQRHRRPDLRHHHPGRRQQLHPFARPLDPDLQRLLPAVRPARGGVRGRGRAGAHRDAPARGGLPGLQRLLRAPDRHPAGPHLPGSARQRDPVERGRARRATRPGSARCSTCSLPRARSPSARAQRVEARLAWSVSLAQLAHDAGVLDPGGETPLRLTNDTTAVPPR